MECTNEVSHGTGEETNACGAHAEQGEPDTYAGIKFGIAKLYGGAHVNNVMSCCAYFLQHRNDCEPRIIPYLVEGFLGTNVGKAQCSLR